jgi:hypothetical protein
VSAGFSMGLGSARPAPWWPEGASWAIETIAGGRRWNASLSCTRPGTKFAQNLAGGWQAFPANMPAITDRGLLVEGSATNLCTTHNATPSLAGWTKSGDAAATFSVVDDAAALASAGLLELCPTGQAYRLDNSGGSTPATVASTGGTPNTTPHSASAMVRSTGNYRVGVQNNSPTFAQSPTYGRRTYQAVPSFSGAQFFILAQPGSIVHFTMNQLEASTASSPIVTSGASTLRPADTASLSFPTGNWRIVVSSEAGATEHWTAASSWPLSASSSHILSIVGYAI